MFDFSSASRFDALKIFIVKYLRKQRSQNLQEIDSNRLTLSILVLLRHLFTFGFYTDFAELDEIERIITPLIKVLDGKTDINPGDTSSNQAGRYARNDKTMIVMEAKHNICSILNMICDIRLDHRLTAVLHAFKSKVMDEDLLSQPSVLMSDFEAEVCVLLGRVERWYCRRRSLMEHSLYSRTLMKCLTTF